MVDWLAGNRVRGTSTERTTSAGFNDGFTGTGGWKEVARTTLGSTSATIDVSSIPDKRYYMVLLDFRRSGTNQNGMRFNNDSGSNYSRRYTYNGASDSTGTSETSFDFTGNGSSADNFAVFYISNLADKEKLVIDHSHERGSTGAGNIGDRREQVSKWANTSSAIDQITAIVSASTYASGTECVVLGWDDSDTHTTNFWEELASVELSSTASEIDSGTFTAKKYLWVQGFANAVSATDIVLEFNSDSGNNYARRNEADGGTDTTATSQPHADMGYGIGSNSHNKFFNSFIINNASNEKLMINHVMHSGGAGAGNAPSRNESVTKWANTSDQITQIKFQAIDSSGFGSGSILKVWGSN